MLRYAIMILLILCATRAMGVEYPSRRYPITYESREVLVAYDSSHSLYKRNESIERVIFVFHGSSFNPVSYIKKLCKITARDKYRQKSTLIITPLYLDKNATEDRDFDFLYWENGPFYGSSNGFFRGEKIRISSYEMTDLFLEQVVAGGLFPNIKTVIIAGQSAGGQMANRYAATGQFESRCARKMGIEVRFIPMSASSYVYFNKDRVVPGTVDQFAEPENPDESFNSWPYGFDNPYKFIRKSKMTPESITKDYSTKKILYLVGEKDNDENGEGLSVSPGSMLQGKTRLQRAHVYCNYLVHVFGRDIMRHQHFRVIKGVGHSGRALLDSDVAKKYIFMPNIGQNVSEN